LVLGFQSPQRAVRDTREEIVLAAPHHTEPVQVRRPGEPLGDILELRPGLGDGEVVPVLLLESRLLLGVPEEVRPVVQPFAVGVDREGVDLPAPLGILTVAGEHLLRPVARFENLRLFDVGVQEHGVTAASKLSYRLAVPAGEVEPRPLRRELGRDLVVPRGAVPDKSSDDLHPRLLRVVLGDLEERVGAHAAVPDNGDGDVLCLLWGAEAFIRA